MEWVKLFAKSYLLLVIIFSDSVSEHIEALYAMAQPWNIDVPLIDCHGYIGSPEYKDGIQEPFPH